MSKSIISNEYVCFFCGARCSVYGKEDGPKTIFPLEKHHIFGGANRKKSEHYGLWVNLCHDHHNEPPDGVHFNKEKMDMLRAIGQRAFQKGYPEKDFMKEFGKNYL